MLFNSLPPLPESVIREDSKIHIDPDFNNFTESGFYNLHAPTGFVSISNNGHSPVIDSNECYCSLIVQSIRVSSSVLYISQLATFFSDLSVYYRSFTGSTWSDWKKIAGANITSSDVGNVFLKSDGSWDKPLIVSGTLTLPASNWDSETNTQTLSVSVDTTRRNSIDVAPESLEAWTACSVYAIEETQFSITFKCAYKPNVDLKFNLSSFIM